MIAGYLVCYSYLRVTSVNLYCLILSQWVVLTLKKPVLCVYTTNTGKIYILIQISCCLKINFISLANHQTCLLQHKLNCFRCLMSTTPLSFYADERSMSYCCAITDHVNSDLFGIPF